MIYGQELYLAIRPTHASPRGKVHDLSRAPGHHDRKLYNNADAALKWLAPYREIEGCHPGTLLEVHLDQLFEIDQSRHRALGHFQFERRYQFHERMMQEHAALAESARTEGQVSTLLDENDLAVLRKAAESWLRSMCRYPGAHADGHHSPDLSCQQSRGGSDVGLASVLRALINAGKLGGGR